jgi:hypothetical protein
MEDGTFPALLQKLVIFLEFLSSGLCVKSSFDTVNVGTAGIRACWRRRKPKVEVAQKE